MIDKKGGGQNLAVGWGTVGHHLRTLEPEAIPDLSILFGWTCNHRRDDRNSIRGDRTMLSSRRRACLASAIAFVGLFGPNSMAGTYTWTGSGPDNFFGDQQNWSPQAVREPYLNRIFACGPE
jgi:hypothetical protein